MSTLRVNDVLKDKVLVSRESAHLLEDALGALMENVKSPGAGACKTPVTLDFEGVGGVAPSFLDELISIFESFVEAGAYSGERCLLVANPPMRLSLKFEALARGHRMTIRVQPDGSWRLTVAES